MTDYYPVIARCVADLEGNTAARCEFYWLARSELEVQLCGLNAPLTPSEMARERLALNDAIQRVENECSSPAAVVESVRVPMCGDERTQRVSQSSCPEVRPVTEVREWKLKTGPTLEPPSVFVRPLIVITGVFLVIGLGSTLYWQRDRVTTLIAGSMSLPYSISRSLPKLDY
jgi:hypothetical protein